MTSRMGAGMLAGVVAAVLAVGLAGCSGAAPKASPSPTPPFASADAAYEAAEATYRGYVDAFNDVNLDDPATFESVYAWLSGAALDADRKEFTAMAAQHLKITGDARVQKVFRSKGGDPLWGDVAVTACYDVHRVDVVDRSGRSLVASDRAPVEQLTVTMSRDAATSTGMKIIRIKIQDSAAECAR